MRRSDYAHPPKRTIGPLHSPGIIGEIISEIQGHNPEPRELTDIKYALHDLEDRFISKFFSIELLFMANDELRKAYDEEEIDKLEQFQNELDNLIQLYRERTSS